MFAMVFFSCLAIGSMLAIGSVIGTWFHFAPAWEALAVERRNDSLAHAAAGQTWANSSTYTRTVLAVPELRTTGAAFRRGSALNAAA